MLTRCLRRESNRIKSSAEQELDDFRNAIAEGAWDMVNRIAAKHSGAFDMKAKANLQAYLRDLVMEELSDHIAYLETAVNESDDLALGSYSDLRADERREFNTAAE